MYKVGNSIGYALLLLNIYACPYRAQVKKFLLGSFLTAVAWAVALVGFALYLRFGNSGRLYGALSAIVAFMLWLYALAVCFVSGMVFNAERVGKEKKA